MKNQVDGLTFAQMIVSGAAAIEGVRQAVNELNVFPVPDGDTGTNMSQTMGAAARELSNQSDEHLGHAADTTASALLSGARGNSGVILSLLFRGFAKQAKEWPTLDGAQFALALQNGVDTAYRAVMKPAEGTMLTVSRVSAARATEAAVADGALEPVMMAALEAAEQALAETVNQNPVLQKAGVIDAGGKGFCVILDGMLAVLQGRAIQAQPTQEGQVRREAADFAEYDTRSIKFGYCTEIIIERNKKKKDPLRLRAFLESLGDSLVLVDDEKLIKIHVHTNHPGRVVEESLTYGSLRDTKIENMRIQHSEQMARQEKKSEPPVKAAAVPLRPFGFVAVAAGDGLRDVFRDLGVDAMVEGGQTMNPSAGDLLRAIDQVPAETVFVLPNNKNIIMAAEQCVELSEKRVVVIPTKSVPQGISAMLSFEPSCDGNANREKMLSAIALVTTGQITYAARDSEFDGLKIAPGDHMAMLESSLLIAHPDRLTVARRLAEEMSKTDPSFITIFYGEGADENEANEIKALFEAQSPDAEVQVLEGGQPVYYYLISAE